MCDLTYQTHLLKALYTTFSIIHLLILIIQFKTTTYFRPKLSLTAFPNLSIALFIFSGVADA